MTPKQLRQIERGSYLVNLRRLQRDQSTKDFAFTTRFLRFSKLMLPLACPSNPDDVRLADDAIKRGYHRAKLKSLETPNQTNTQREIHTP